MKKLLTLLFLIVAANIVSAQDYILKNFIDHFSITKGGQGIGIYGNDIKDSQGNYFLKSNSLFDTTNIVHIRGIETITGAKTFSQDITVNGYTLGAGAHTNTGLKNTVFGFSAGSSLTTGKYNTGVGFQSLNLLTYGWDNTGIGYEALKFLVNGSLNVAVGSFALEHVTNATYNVAIGHAAGVFITTGSNNTEVGVGAGYSLTTGKKNTMIGGFSGEYSNASDSANTYIGYGAGASVKGSKNVIIGAWTAGWNGSAGSTFNNKLIIASGDTLNQNPNQLISGDFAAQTLLINGRLSSRDAPVGPTDVVRLTDLTGGTVAVAPSGTAAGDLTGTYPNPTVAQFNGRLPSYYLNYNNLANKPVIPGDSNLVHINGAEIVTGSKTFSGPSTFSSAVGIGTSTPNTMISGYDVKLGISGNGSGVSGRTAFVVKNTSANSAATFAMLNSSNAGITIQASGSSYVTGANGGVGTFGGIGLYFNSDGDIASGGTSKISFAQGGYFNSPQFLIDGNQNTIFNAYGHGSANIGTTTPVASALLQVSSTTQGVLLPRMTTAQKNAIWSPAEGLAVYDVTLHAMNYYNGTKWTAFSGDSTGTLPGGGALTYTHTMSYGLLGGNFNNSGNITSSIDTSIVQTIANFYPKGDQRYLTNTSADSRYQPLENQRLSTTNSPQFQDYLRITATGGVQSLLMGNQNSLGVNKPAIMNAANGTFSWGYGNSWTGNGGTYTSLMNLDVNGNLTAASFNGSGSGLTGTAASLSIGGNAATATNSTQWNGYNFTFLNGAVNSYVMSYNGTGFSLSGATELKTFLGLGSNAFTSTLTGTGYLKLSGTTPSYLSSNSVLSDIGAVPYTGATADVDLVTTGKGVYAEFAEIGHGSTTGAGKYGAVIYNVATAGNGALLLQGGDATHLAMAIEDRTGSATNYISFYGHGAARFLGADTASTFVKSGATSTNILLAGGGDIPQSTFALASGGNNYIQNQTASAQTASFWISGTAQVNGLVTGNQGFYAPTGYGITGDYGAFATNGTGNVLYGQNTSATGDGVFAAGGSTKASGHSALYVQNYANVDIAKFYSDEIDFLQPVNLKGYTVATLPAGVQGDTAYVTDGIVRSYLAPVVGGGSTVVPVFYNGTNWVAH
ncbi:MAG TPA: hypothetical protein VNW95_15000 [Mucilaginibacter sp.]|jgi:hypothetical protein|nr:hypothetical protein [Mucilaginibacter sp.]